MEQFHSCFNYKITDSSISGYLAQVSAQLTTFDSDSILSQYEKELNTYLGSADAVIDGSQKDMTNLTNFFLTVSRTTNQP